MCWSLCKHRADGGCSHTAYVAKQLAVVGASVVIRPVEGSIVGLYGGDWYLGDLATGCRSTP